MFARKISCFLLLLSALLVLTPAVTHAQEEELKSDLEYFYDDLTMDKISKLYWRLGKLDINNDEHVDNFLFINECDIYNDYFFNEFEWVTVREKARIFLKENSETFPVRFKYVQPLRLAEYNEETGMFAIQDEYQIKGYRKFEVMSSDFSNEVCSMPAQSNIKHYPRLLLVEFTQPLLLKEIPISPQRAQKYVKDKLEYFETLPEDRKTKKNLYAYRDAYIVMKIKMFSYKGQENITNGWMRAEVYGMLEGYEIYADKDHTTLLYFENFIRDKDDSRPLNVKLQEQYEAIRKRRGDFDDNDAEDEYNPVIEEPVQEEDQNSLMNLKQSTQ